MKRVLIVATTSYAGMGPYVSGIVNTFLPNDDVYYFFHDYDDLFFRKNVKEELHSRSTFYKLANSIWNKLYDLIFGHWVYEKDILDLCHEKRIELIHFINGCGSCSFNRKLESMGIKVLGTVHDLYPHEVKKAPHKMLRHRVSVRRLQTAIWECHNLLTNSKSQYVELQKLFPDKNLFYHEFPSLVSKDVKKGKDIPIELRNVRLPYILFFGRIEEYKGITLLYKAFTEVPELYNNYLLVIAGNGTLPFERAVGEINVIMINRYIKDTEIRYMYEQAACVVYPYISATQSGVLSLAFYFRTPTLTSDVPFFRSIIESAGAGMLFKAGDLENLKQKLLLLLSSDTSNLKICEAEYYDKNYNDKAIREQLLTIYDSINKK